MQAPSVTVSATDSAAISSTSAAAALSVAASSGNGVALGGGGAIALNDLTGTANAYVQSSTLGTGAAPIGAVSITTSHAGAITATVLAVSLSAAVGGGTGVGVSIGLSVARNLIGWEPTGLASTTYLSTNTSAPHLNTGDTVKVVGGPLDGQTFRYIGSTLAGPLDLSVQSYQDTTGWQQVGETSSDGQVQAYSAGSDIFSTGARRSPPTRPRASTRSSRPARSRSAAAGAPRSASAPAACSSRTRSPTTCART